MLIGCASCAALNRLPSERLELVIYATCSLLFGFRLLNRSGWLAGVALASFAVFGLVQPLLDGKPVLVSEATFDAAVARTELPVVVDFWADWCGPCHAMAPAYERAAAQMQGRVRFAKLNTEEAPDLAARYGIRSIPTMIVFRDGREAARMSGAMDAHSIEDWVSQASK